MRYFDATALAKRYVREKGSVKVRRPPVVGCSRDEPIVERGDRLGAHAPNP